MVEPLVLEGVACMYKYDTRITSKTDIPVFIQTNELTLQSQLIPKSQPCFHLCAERQHICYGPNRRAEMAYGDSVISESVFKVYNPTFWTFFGTW